MDGSSWQSPAQTPLPSSWSRALREPPDLHCTRGARSGEGKGHSQGHTAPSSNQPLSGPSPVSWSFLSCHAWDGQTQLQSRWGAGLLLPHSPAWPRPQELPWSLLGDRRRIGTQWWVPGMGDPGGGLGGTAAGSSELTTPPPCCRAGAFIINNSKYLIRRHLPLVANNTAINAPADERAHGGAGQECPRPGAAAKSAPSPGEERGSVIFHLGNELGLPSPCPGGGC